MSIWLIRAGSHGDQAGRSVDTENMPDNLRHAHARNDEMLERIHIGRRFRNDTERLEKLFELYTKMTAAAGKAAPTKARRGKSMSGQAVQLTPPLKAMPIG